MGVNHDPIKVNDKVPMGLIGSGFHSKSFTLGTLLHRQGDGPFNLLPKTLQLIEMDEPPVGLWLTSPKFGFLS